MLTSIKLIRAHIKAVVTRIYTRTALVLLYTAKLEWSSN